jgi:hypothetical protein
MKNPVNPYFSVDWLFPGGLTFSLVSPSGTLMLVKPANNG